MIKSENTEHSWSIRASVSNQVSRLSIFENMAVENGASENGVFRVLHVFQTFHRNYSLLAVAGTIFLP